MYDYHLLLEGDAAKANRWLPYARNLLHATHRRRLATGSASLTQQSIPESGVYIRVDSTLLTNRIYVRALGTEWFLAAYRTTGAIGNAIEMDIFFYSPERHELRRAFRFKVADHLAWVPNTPYDFEDVERIDYFDRYIELDVHDESEGTDDANQSWRGYGRFEKNPVPKAPEVDPNDYDWYTLLSTGDGAGPRAFNLQDDGTLPYDVSLGKTNAELLTFSPAATLRPGDEGDTQYAVADFTVEFDSPESHQQYDKFLLLYMRRTRALDELGVPIPEQTKFDYEGWLNDPAAADVPDPLYYDEHVNYYWHCPRSYESAHSFNPLRTKGVYSYCPNPYTDGKFVYYFLDPGILYHSVSGIKGFYYERDYLVEPTSWTLEGANPWDIGPGETFEHRALYRYSIATGAISKFKGYIDTAYTEWDEIELDTIPTLFGVKTYYPTAFLQDDSRRVLGWAESETETYDAGSDRVGVYNDKMHFYSAPADDLLDDAGNVVMQGGIENAVLSFTLDLVELFQPPGHTHNDVGDEDEQSTELALRSGEHLYVEDWWVLAGGWDLDKDGNPVDNTTYGMLIKRRFGGNPHFAPGALLRYSREKGVSIVYAGGRVDAHEFLGSAAHFGKWVLFGLEVAPGPPQTTPGGVRNMYRIDMTSTWNATLGVNKTLKKTDTAKVFDELGNEISGYTWNTQRPGFDAGRPEITYKFQPAFFGEITDA